MKHFLTTLLLLFVLVGCDRNMPYRHESYLPSRQLLQKGLVSKYYQHRDRIGNNDPKTDIRYRKQVLEDNVLLETHYNAAFEPIFETDTDISRNEWKRLRATQFRDGENNIEIQDSTYLDWKGGKTKVTTTYGEWQNIDEHLEMIDTNYEGRSAKCFKGTRSNIKIETQDTSVYHLEQVFASDLGLVSQQMYSDVYEFKMELDEIMSIAEFERRSQHDIKRVGHIDTLAVMDKGSDFKVCTSFDDINDYYNDDRAQFIGGVGSLRALLQQKLNPELLKGQSGYLSYHFVINCKGKAGWFTTEEADLAYNRIRFSDACRNHLYAILSEVEVWKPLSIRGEARDAYTYITFKIKDGEIIDILP